MGLNEEAENNKSTHIPSSEWRFHRDIYLDRRDAQAIVHAHSPHATAVSTHGKSIPPFHYMIALAGGEDIKCAEYATFGTKELSNNVIKALKNRSACLMSNHGQVAFGKNLEEAFDLAQEVENICHQYTIALKLGNPKILSFEEMKKVLEKAKDYKKVEMIKVGEHITLDIIGTDKEYDPSVYERVIQEIANKAKVSVS